jgi:hypothetical protein
MMKRLMLVLAVLSAIVPLPPAEAACTGINVQVTPFAYEDITVSSTAIGATAATINSATGKAAYALFTTETNPLRYTVDGTTPTATLGHLVSAGQQIEVCGFVAVSQLRMIRTGSDATVRATYYKAN